MSDEQCQPTDMAKVRFDTTSQPCQTYTGHQYSGTSLHGNSSAQFGDIYHISNVNHSTQDQSQTPLRPSISIPFRRDRDFVERDVLDDILQRASQPAARIGLVGLGGVGKTQVAIEYAYRRREAEPQTWVFWVHASSAGRFEECYRQIAQQVRISNWSDPKANVLSMVHAWLSDENHGPWTMIVDNADSGQVMFGSDDSGLSPSAASSMQSTSPVFSDRSLSDYLPLSVQGSIIITSRSRAVVEGLIEYTEDIFHLGPMMEDDAVNLLAKKVQRQQQDTDRSNLVALVRELEYMPLAISQAAAYICQRGSRMTVSTYLERLQKSDLDRDRLLQNETRDPRRDGLASNSIIITWHTSFEHIRQTRGSAARLLALMSMFDREGIPQRLLQGQYSAAAEEEEEEELGEEPKIEGMQTEYDFEDDLLVLSAYNLIGSSTNNELFDMHRLVQFSTRKWLKLRGELGNWQDKYINILDIALPAEDYNTLPKWDALFPHIEATMSYSFNNHDHILKRASVLHRGTWYALENGRYGMAMQLASASLTDRERILGPHHIDTLYSRRDYASALIYQGKYVQAVEMSQRATEGFEKQLGLHHCSTLESNGILASSLGGLGKYDQAEEIQLHVLGVLERELGTDHLSTLEATHSLALSLQNQGKYQQAEEKYRTVLAISQKELGSSHPRTLLSMGSVASILHDLGKYEQAEEMYWQTLAASENVFRPNHPNTLIDMGDLALTLRKQNRYKEAERLYRLGLAGIKKELGVHHKTTLIFMHNLAVVLFNQHKHEQAKETFQQVLNWSETTLKKDDPLILGSLDFLAEISYIDKNYREAVRLYDRAVEGYESSLGLSQPKTSRCREHRQRVIEHMNEHPEESLSGSD